MSEPAVRVEDLSYTYPGRESPTLVDISFELREASWTVLAGATGSGKSTLLAALAGWSTRSDAEQTQGRVLLFGRDARTMTLGERAQHVGLVLQSAEDQVATTTVEAEVTFGLENMGLPVDEIRRRATDALRQFKLENLAAARTNHLSGGQMQRLVLASILAMRPRLLLLDEPFGQLDSAAAAELMPDLDRLRAGGLTIVIAEHRLDELLPRADRVLILRDGRLSADVNTNCPERLDEAFASSGLEAPEMVRLACGLDWRRVELPAIDRAQKPPRPALSPNGGEGFLCHPLAVGSAISRVATRLPNHDGQLPMDRREAPLLRASKLGFQFPSSQAPLWSDVAFELYAGERVALVGPNGSGKSTLLAVLASLLQPTWGSVHADLPSDGRASSGLVLQNPDLMLFCSTVRDELAFGPAQLGLSKADVERRVSQCAAALELEGITDEPPLGLSRGERLRVAIGATMTLEPRLLLLDEPTTGQDPAQVEAMLRAVSEAVRQRRTALLFATHDLRTVARHADRVLVLGNGALLAQCTPAELLDDDELLAATRMRRPPLFEFRRRMNLRALSVEQLIAEVAR